MRHPGPRVGHVEQYVDARVLCRQLRLDRPRSSRRRRVRPAPRGNRRARPTDPSNDLWIAASATSNGLPLITLNRRHFEPHLCTACAVLIAAGRHRAVRERGRPTVPGPSRRSGDDGTRTHDPLLAKPDRPRSLPAKAENGTGRGRFGIVPGCPLETGQDCCEWHASGTATRTTFVGPGSVGTSSTVGGGPTPATPGLLARAAGPRQPSEERSRP
jgi:hypothetical protein